MRIRRSSTTQTQTQTQQPLSGSSGCYYYYSYYCYFLYFTRLYTACFTTTTTTYNSIMNIGNNNNIMDTREFMTLWNPHRSKDMKLFSSYMDNLSNNNNNKNDIFTDDDDDDSNLINPCIIKVLGVGGGGGNAVNRMIQTDIQGVNFWAVNTDAQALAKSLAAPNTLNIGKKLTKGLGAGGNPEIGRGAGEESRDEIRRVVSGTDLLFVTAGMGGGTGSGAAPIAADVAREEGCLVVGVVTKPFVFEGRKRMQQALEAIEALREKVDTLIVISNDKLLQIVPDNTPVTDAFLVADDILRQGVVGISEIIVKPGLINVDFADVRAVMANAGTALMGVGTGSGKSRATDAAVAAISSPLLDFPIREAQGVVFNVVGGEDLSLAEINAAAEVIYENTSPEANIIFGALIDPAMEGECSITVLATGFKDDGKVLSDKRLELERGATFYRERRLATKSPLGENANRPEEIMDDITRGALNNPSMAQSSRNPQDNLGRTITENIAEEKKRGGVVGFFRRRFKRGNN